MNRTRRFHVGMTGSVPDSAIVYRIVQGGHAPQDYVLEIHAPGWCRVPFGLGCLEADFFYENEDALHPPGFGVLGGRMYLNRLHSAVEHGWLMAARMTQQERRNHQRSGIGTHSVDSDPPQHCPACRQTRHFWKRVSSTMWVCADCDPIEERFR